ncbi:ABC transporter substrate-binding protein [Pararhodobacter oceanensis]|nr:ABC transporter substrate-binding protein [Pararhodobacter oceanensis]
MKRFTLLSTVASFAATLALAAPVWADSPLRGGILQVGLADDPPELDPHLSSSNASRTILHNIFATLVEVDDKLQIQPELAERWEVSEDGRQYTFYLRDGVKFHDGTTLDADAVAFNFDRMRDADEFGSARAGELAFVEDVKVDGPLQVTVTLSQPYGGFLPALASWSGMIVSPTAVEEHGRDFGQVLVGAGPFRFVNRIRDDRVVLERFDEYFKDGLPYLDGVVYRPFVDAEARIVNLETGSIHIINTVPGRAVNRLQESEDINLSIVGGLGFRGIWVNVDSDELGSRERRAALSACIDRRVVVNSIFGEAAVPAVGPFSPATWVVDSAEEAPHRDVDAARAALAEAGVPDGFSFPLLITPDDESIRVASIYAAMCSEVGIDIQLQQVEFGTILSRMAEGNYAGAQIELSPRNDPDLSAHPWFHSSGGVNFSHYASPEMDRVLDEARAAVDQGERRALYREALELFNTDFPYVFVYHLQEMKAHRAEMMGYRHIPDSMMRFEDVWLQD